MELSFASLVSVPCRVPPLCPLPPQYSLEVVLHYRLRKTYPCLTTDPSKADLFFIPFYASLEVLRWHFDPKATEKQRDKMHNGLARWLARQPSFQVGPTWWELRGHYASWQHTH